MKTLLRIAKTVLHVIYIILREIMEMIDPWMIPVEERKAMGIDLSGQGREE